MLGRGGGRPDAVLIVADATSLARNLYFANEVLETGSKVVIALNMFDEARTGGIDIDVSQLSMRLGATVVPIVARTGEGLGALRGALATALLAPRRLAPALALSDGTRRDIDSLALVVDREMPTQHDTARAWATWVLLSIDETTPDDLSGVPAPVRLAAQRIAREATAQGRNLDLEIIGARYRRVDAIVDETVRHRPPAGPTWTARIDSVLTHRVFGALIFIAVMLALFQALFTWSEPAITLIQASIASAQNALAGAMPPGPFTDLLADGVVAGVGNVVGFVPQIGLLFLFIGIMEDVGYLARVAFVIDRVMGGVGLHGKSFVPMLSGFSCAVPAVMATRTLENRTDRMLTMAVLPLMSCSARLPIYVLVIATVFRPEMRVFGVASAGAVTLLAMYLLSVTAALTAAAVLRRTVLRGPRPTLVLELPPYRRPVMRVLLQNTWRQVRAFLIDAGTTILALTIIVWAVLSYPRDKTLGAHFSSERAAIERTQAPGAGTRRATRRARRSGARRLSPRQHGRPSRPVDRAGARAARLRLAHRRRHPRRVHRARSIRLDDGDRVRHQRRGRAEPAVAGSAACGQRADGTPLMTPLTGVSLMVFFVLACQCGSTLAVVRRESGSWAWPAFIFVYQTTLAYVAALIVYQGGRFLGFGS